VRVVDDADGGRHVTRFLDVGIAVVVLGGIAVIVIVAGRHW
jgi:hypothetical protein